MPSRLTTAALLVSTSALAACAHRSTSAPARGTTRVNYAIQQAYADSVEQAPVGAFLTEYQQRARPLQQAGNYLGELQLLRQMAARYPASNGIRDLTTQQIGTIWSFLGDPAEALRLFDQVDEDSPAPLVDTTRLEQLALRTPPRPSPARRTARASSSSTRRITFHKRDC
jgi:hypothetical protein